MEVANLLHLESLRKQRERRARDGNAVTHRYERTKNGKLMRTYRNMLSRVVGIARLKAHLYEGKSILPKEDFYRWALASNEFHTLYDAWAANGYRCGDSPSVDRIDSSLGYVLGNMEWVTHRENSRRGAVNRNLKQAAE